MSLLCQKNEIFLIIFVVLVLLSSSFAEVEERTVIDYERGLRWAKSWNKEYSQYGYQGADRGTPFTHPDTFIILEGQALQHLNLGSPDKTFPLTELLAFERDEIRQGHDPFFITATFDGKRRPVLSKSALSSVDPNRVQTVNIRDDRYIKYFVKNFIRRRNLPSDQLWNLGICLDNSGYFHDFNKYGVFDDDGQFHRVVKWDEPFPQTYDEWEDAGKWALHRIKELAPDIWITHNAYIDALEDESRYAEVFGAIDGIEPEGFGGSGTFNTSHEKRDSHWHYHARMIPPDGADAYKIQVLYPGLNDDQHDLEQNFLAYLILSGPNAFFGPHDSNWREIPPAMYAGMKNKLGSPIEHPVHTQEPGKGVGHRFFSRRCQGGIAYLNLCGITKQITLPNDRPYYDPNGNPVSQVILDDLVATYITTDPSERMAKPRINPRRPNLVTGPLTITLEAGPFSPVDDMRIYYTLDGTEPDEGSMVYTGPFEIFESCVVKARAFDNTRSLYLPSFTNFANYIITNDLPTVEFHHTSDCGSEFLEHDYPVVSLSHVSAHPVTIRYTPLRGRTQGTAIPTEDYELEPGILTIRPGEQHRYFYVHIINDEEAEPDETIMISISDPVNATLGEKTIYTYTIEDNDNIVPNIERFETGDFSGFDWITSGDADWAIATENSNSGIYSAKAGTIGNYESSTLSMNRYCIEGDITFYYKVSSEQNFDYLKFYIDGVEQGKWSGDQDWIEVSFPIEAGIRTFEWTYSKDGSASRGEDTAWIDDIMFPIE